MGNNGTKTLSLTRAIVCSLKFGSFTAFSKRCNTSGQEIVGMQIFGGGQLPAFGAAFFNNVDSGEEACDRSTKPSSSRSLEAKDPEIWRRQWHLTLQAAKSNKTTIQGEMIIIWRQCDSGIHFAWSGVPLFTPIVWNFSYGSIILEIFVSIDSSRDWLVLSDMFVKV